MRIVIEDDGQPGVSVSRAGTTETTAVAGMEATAVTAATDAGGPPADLLGMPGEPVLQTALETETEGMLAPQGEDAGAPDPLIAQTLSEAPTNGSADAYANGHGESEIH